MIASSVSQSLFIPGQGKWGQITEIGKDAKCTQGFFVFFLLLPVCSVLWNSRGLIYNKVHL